MEYSRMEEGKSATASALAERRRGNIGSDPDVKPMSISLVNTSYARRKTSTEVGEFGT